MSKASQSKLQVAFGHQFAESVVSVAPATRSPFNYPWGIAVGVVVMTIGGAAGLGGALLGALGGGSAALASTVAAERKARADTSVPGGSRVLIAATAESLVFISMSLWQNAPSEIAASVPFAGLTSIQVSQQRRGHSLEFRLQDGKSWAFQTGKWSDLQQGIPRDLVQSSEVQSS